MLCRRLAGRVGLLVSGVGWLRFVGFVASIGSHGLSLSARSASALKVIYLVAAMAGCSVLGVGI